MTVSRWRSSDVPTLAATGNTSPTPLAFLTFTLHAHLPYVVNHGTWPHGMEWLHEAAAETYLPLLRVLGRLERDGIALHCNLSLSPILMEQLAHPVFRAEFPRYVTRKIISAREDEAFFQQSGENHYAEVARFWHRFFTQALDDFQALEGDIVGAFRRFHQAGVIEVMTCCATHGYLPLLGTDESVRAQVKTAVQTHTRYMGEAPRGIWSPECGYRPAGRWSFPVTDSAGVAFGPAAQRIGVEQAFAESALDYFFVDTHLVEESQPVSSPYGSRRNLPAMTPQAMPSGEPPRSVYHPYSVVGEYGRESSDRGHTPVSVFPRDPRTGIQVWSGEIGYPGDGNYCDFHKKRWPGGHRYWRVTGPNVDMGNKEPYFPQQAEARIQGHASHFVQLIYDALGPGFHDATPQILCAPFDAELFGHWWFEGPLWLEAVARTLHDRPGGIELISASKYLEQYPRAANIAMHEGSWGAEGTNQVWLNPETAWTYTHIYPAELFVRDVCSAELWRANETSQRIVKQLCRELLLLESSDWQFLITTGAARDYAELRFLTHNEQFTELKTMWLAYEEAGALNEHQSLRLAAIEERDSIFADIDPGFWASEKTADPKSSAG
jgi:1,4-alpha-glucan branching enzyme